VPNLSLVVCGAPLASRAHDIAALAAEAGWTVTLLVTSAATAWLDDEASSGFRNPDEPKPARPDAVVVCPMTFNTANKWALGVADTQPLSLLAEALGAQIPIVAVPFVNQSLSSHPAWSDSLSRLSTAGVRILQPDAGEPGPLLPGTGATVAARFDPRRVLEALH
jgi:phosphopantothenoylcysteine decarboxylase